MAATYFDFQILLWKFRPPCPEQGCRRRMFIDRGIFEEEVYWCPRHGWYVAVPLEHDGDFLPLFRLERYA